MDIPPPSPTHTEIHSVGIRLRKRQLLEAMEKAEEERRGKEDDESRRMRDDERREREMTIRFRRGSSNWETKTVASSGRSGGSGDGGGEEGSVIQPIIPRPRAGRVDTGPASEQSQREVHKRVLRLKAY